MGATVLPCLPRQIRLVKKGTSVVTQEDIDRRIAKIFHDRAQDTLDYLNDTLNELLPGNHSPAEGLLLAHFLAGYDGYNDITFDRKWPPSGHGWGTQFSYLAKVREGEIVTFAFQVLCGEHCRELAVLVDYDRIGQRTPDKNRRENLLMSLGFRVMSFSESEAINNSSECYERVNLLLFELNNEVLAEAGHIRG